MSITAFSFGEWLPDLPDLGNPGLTEALNVRPIAKSYAPYLPLSDFAAGFYTMPSTVFGAYQALQQGTANQCFYAGDVFRLYANVGGSGLNFTNISSASTYSSTSAWEFVQNGSLVIAASKENYLQKHTVGSTSTFTVLSASAYMPKAAHADTVGQFLVVGNTTDAVNGYVGNRLQWPAIADISNWPQPNSSTAIATQSGEQFLDPRYGEITGVFGSDQHAVVLQKAAVTRMTYVGPPVVFQFDVISVSHGCFFHQGAIQIEGLVYFLAADGFYVTDGVSVKPLGVNKVDAFFRQNFDTSNPQNVHVGHDPRNHLIKWSVPLLVGGGMRLFIFNYMENRWSGASQLLECFVRAPAQNSIVASQPLPLAFSLGNVLSQFNATPGTATIISGEVEPQPGGCALINGIKPIVASSGTAPAITVQVGSRDDQATTVSYSSTTTPTSRTGFADFRSDARYHRARVYIAGNFEKAMGLEIDVTPTGGM